MAMYINPTLCINCYACYEECPVGAIKKQNDTFKVSKELCVECKDIYEEPQCIAICPIDFCITRLEEENVYFKRPL